MSSRSKLRELLEYIRAAEEQARGLYDAYLARLRDPRLTQEFERIRSEEAGHVQIAEELLKLLAKYEAVRLKVQASGPAGVPMRLWYVLAGVVLGLGAPLGSLAFQFASAHGRAIAKWLASELAAHRWHYVYMTAGSVAAFALSGWFVGLLHERLRARARDLTVRARVLEDLSAKDSLTGLFNFGYVQERLKIESERAERFQTPLSCLMMDVDNLKEVNDRYGHPAGDEVLRQIAGLIRNELRVIDTATRYGGDEFLLILPVTPQAGAYAAAERIRQKARELRVSYRGQTLNVTVSVGVGTFPAPDVQDAEALIEAADAAMYEAKRLGRDRTGFSREAPDARVAGTGG